MAVECGGMRPFWVWRTPDTVVAVARRAAAGMVKRFSKSTATKIYALSVAFGMPIERIRDTFRKDGEEVPSRHGIVNVLKRGRDGQNLRGGGKKLKNMPDAHWAKLKAKLDDEPRLFVEEMKVLPLALCCCCCDYS